MGKDRTALRVVISKQLRKRPVGRVRRRLRVKF